MDDEPVTPDPLEDYAAWRDPLEDYAAWRANIAERARERMLADVEVRFTYHPPHGDQVDRYTSLRAAGKALARLIVLHCPAGFERDNAVERVEEAIMWANAAIARREP